MPLPLQRPAIVAQKKHNPIEKCKRNTFRSIEEVFLFFIIAKNCGPKETVIEIAAKIKRKEPIPSTEGLVWKKEIIA